MPLQAVQTFEKMAPLLEKQGAAIVQQVGCVYHFEIRANKDDQPTVITVDLKNGNGKITFAAEGTPDCTFVMLDADFMDLVTGKIKGQAAFMGGKMKIKGNMAKALKFNPSVFPKDAKL